MKNSNIGVIIKNVASLKVVNQIINQCKLQKYKIPGAPKCYM